jgi:hypothetical protein
LFGMVLTSCGGKNAFERSRAALSTSAVISYAQGARSIGRGRLPSSLLH